MKRSVLLILFLVVAVARFSLAADGPADGGAGKGEVQKSGEDPAKPTGGKANEAPPTNVKMEQVEIRGEFENPDLFYIIPRRKAEMDMGSLSMDYSSEIMRPMIEHVFEAEHAKDRGKGGTRD